MAAFDPRDRGEVSAAKGRPGFGGDRSSMGNLGAERSRMRALGADFITPKYGWDQAQFSDFGITGGLMNAFKGVLAGNTYAGRTPQGLRAGYASDPSQRTPMAPQGGGYGQNLFNPIQYNAVVRGGMYQGGTNQPRLAQLAQGAPQMFMPQQAPQAPQMPVQQPMGFQPPKTISTGGQYGISQFRPGYNFLRGGLR